MVEAFVETTANINICVYIYIYIYIYICFYRFVSYSFGMRNVLMSSATILFAIGPRSTPRSLIVSVLLSSKQTHTCCHPEIEIEGTMPRHV